MHAMCRPHFIMGSGRLTTLYGYRGSGSAAIEAALRRCDIAFEHVEAASWDASTDVARLRRANALVQVPTLVLPDDTVLTESAAILIHLGLSHPSKGLLPAEDPQRAQAISGLVYLAANCYATIGVIDYPERWSGGSDEAAQSAIRRGARRRLHDCWEVFADRWGPERSGAEATPFLGGEHPGALDLLAAVVSKWAGTRAHLQRVRPALLDTLVRVDTHPDVRPVFARHWP